MGASVCSREPDLSCGYSALISLSYPNAQQRILFWFFYFLFNNKIRVFFNARSEQHEGVMGWRLTCELGQNLPPSFFQPAPAF